MNIDKEKLKDWYILIISGKFVIKNLTSIRKAFEDLEKTGISKVALDLSRVTHLDSSAITILLNYHKRLKTNNGILVIFGPSDDIMNIFSIVGFDNTVQVFPTRKDFEQSL